MSEQIQPRRSIPPAPVHPLAALATIVLDNIFGVIEFLDPIALLFTSLTVGTIGAVATTLVQHYLVKEEWGPSVAKGVVMGILAGVPFQVVGTAVGVPLLAWAGIHQWVRLPGPRNETGQLAPGGEIVDVDSKNE